MLVQGPLLYEKVNEVIRFHLSYYLLMWKHFSIEYFQQERHLGFKNTSRVWKLKCNFFLPPLHKGSNVTKAVEIQKQEN